MMSCLCSWCHAFVHDVVASFIMSWLHSWCRGIVHDVVASVPEEKLLNKFRLFGLHHLACLAVCRGGLGLEPVLQSIFSRFVISLRVWRNVSSVNSSSLFCKLFDRWQLYSLTQSTDIFLIKWNLILSLINTTACKAICGSRLRTWNVMNGKCVQVIDLHRCLYGERMDLLQVFDNEC